MDINEILIENVKQQDCLYNLASKSYKNVEKKSEIGEGIGALVNLSGDACRKRFKGLRDTYKRRKRTAELASGSGAASPAKKWKYMEALTFLDACKDSRATIGSVDDEENDLCRAIINVDDDQNYMGNILDCSSSTLLTENLATDGSCSEANRSQQKKYSKKQSDAELTNLFKEAMRDCANSVKELAGGGNKENDRDPTILLFESLAKKMLTANLPPAAVASIESKVINEVFEGIKMHSKP